METKQREGKLNATEMMDRIQTLDRICKRQVDRIQCQESQLRELRQKLDNSTDALRKVMGAHIEAATAPTPGACL